MNRIDAINEFVRARGYTSYLEIGCQADVAFSGVELPEGALKIGVDPVSGGTLRMPSDEFFDMSTLKFDVIFVDGNHHHDQVWRDLCNALHALKEGGVILMHDCLPPDADHESLGLCGTAWRAFAKTRERIELEGYTGDFDYGVGVLWLAKNSSPIRVGRPLGDLTYADFVANREAWMRPLSADQFRRLAKVGHP